MGNASKGKAFSLRRGLHWKLGAGVDALTGIDIEVRYVVDAPRRHS